MSETDDKSIKDNIKVNIEYCGVCDHSGSCLSLAQTITDATPEAIVVCKRGRRGAFEVIVNGKLVYSKLKTMALPNYEEVATVVKEAALGEPLREIKGEQPINCVVS